MIHYDRRDKTITIIGSQQEIEGDFKAVVIGVREVLKKEYTEIASEIPEEIRPEDDSDSVDKFVNYVMVDTMMQVLYGDPHIEIAGATELTDQEADEILNGTGGDEDM